MKTNSYDWKTIQLFRLKRTWKMLNLYQYYEQIVKEFEQLAFEECSSNMVSLFLVVI